MFTNLAHFFEQQRTILGLRPSRVAQLAGRINVNKSASRIRQFEMTGYISRELFEQIAVVLGIGNESIAKLIELDRREFAVLWTQRIVPSELKTMHEAEEWASTIAKEVRRHCCLVWHRRISSWFDKDGVLFRRSMIVPIEPTFPWIRHGQKTFLIAAADCIRPQTQTE